MKYFETIFIGILVIIGSSCMTATKITERISVEPQYYIIPEIGIETTALANKGLLAKEIGKRLFI